MSKRKVYVVPEVRIVEVCQENLMQDLSKWNPGSGPNQSIIEGNPDDENDPNPEPDPYAEW